MICNDRNGNRPFTILVIFLLHSKASFLVFSLYFVRCQFFFDNIIISIYWVSVESNTRPTGSELDAQPLNNLLGTRVLHVFENFGHILDDFLDIGKIQTSTHTKGLNFRREK